VKEESSRLDWLSHILPWLSALFALAMLVLTPIWALGYYRQPFVGALLEPNNILSKITGRNWPVTAGGARWPDQLVAINGQPEGDAPSVNAALQANEFALLELTFQDPGNGVPTGFYVRPVQMPLGDFLTLFVIPYAVGLVFLLIGLWAYRLRSELRASRALMIFSAAVSVATTTFFDMNTTHHVVLLWTISLPVAASALIHLALVFPQQMRFVDQWPSSRFLSWLLCLVIAFPSALEILSPSSATAYIYFWQACYLYMAVAIGFFLITLVWRIVRSTSAIVRQQSRVIIFGAVLSFAPMMILYLLPTALSRNPQVFHPSIYFPLLILLPLSITYAILRYRLLDVDRVLANILTYALTTGAALLIFYGLLTALSLVIRQTIQPDNPLLIAVYLLVLVLGLQPLRTAVQRLIDRFFYRAPADYRRVLNTLSRDLVVTPNLERTLELLAGQLREAIALENFVIYLYDDERAFYVPHSPGDRTYPPLTDDYPLVNIIRASTGAFWFPPSKALPPELDRSDTFAGLGCCAFVPLRYEGNLTGFMGLGLRRSGDPYTGDDLDFLNTVAGQSALALENARLFTNLHRTLDQTLEMKSLMDDIFASIATGVITTDVRRKVTLFNRAAEEILGIPVQEVLGRPLPDALPLCPDLETVAIEAVERGTVTLSREVTPNLPSRGELTLRLSCSPLRDAYLGTKGATLVFEDLTERRKLEAEQERIRQTFGRVVAPRVRDRLLSDASHLRLDGLRQTATILFADLSGFTSFSESVQPELLFKLLNDYLSLAAQAILEHEGTLDKFMGDAVMALWNAPDPQEDHALRAVRAALSILERSRQAHARMKNPAHHLMFRIGVTSGEAMVGNVGTRELFNYTAIGDTVNLAQRLETAAQPGQILIDQATFDTLAGRVRARALEPLLVKGKAQPVAVYDLRGIK
jgi:PAS domain S-box-containing protein